MLPPHPLAGELEVIDQVFGASCDAIVVISAPPRSLFLYANEAFLRNTGYTRGEVLGCSPRMLEGPRSEASGLRELRSALLDGQSYLGEVLNYRKDGAEYWVQWSISPRRDAAGEVLYWVATQRDVTRQHEDDQRLREALHRLSFHVNNSPLAVVEWDRDLRIIGWSERAEEIFGWSYTEVLGRHPREFQLAVEADVARMWTLADELQEKDRSRVTVRVTNNTRSGEVRECVWYSSALRDDEGKLISVLSLVEDVSDEVRAARERMRLEQELQQGQKLESLGLLAGGIAHDFNNMLAAILGYTKLALDRLGDEDAARRHLCSASDAARRAAHLTQQLLLYAGEGTYETTAVDLSQQIGDMTSLLNALTSQQVQLELALDPHVPPIEADVSQLQQILMNLVINAAEACAATGGSVTIQTGVAHFDRTHPLEGWPGDPLEPGTYVELVVADEGPGMDAATRDRIFDPFFSTKFTGRGLGLAAVAGILRRYGGGVEVDTEPGCGARFRVLFPAARCGSVAAAPHPVRAPACRPEGCVLVVDDEESLRLLARETLRSAGCEVLMAADGDQAVDLFRDRHGALSGVVLDLTMPGRSGAEVLREIRRIDARVPVVLTSGYARETAIDGLDAGRPPVFLQKPFDPDDLLRKLSEAQQR